MKSAMIASLAYLALTTAPSQAMDNPAAGSANAQRGVHQSTPARTTASSCPSRHEPPLGGYPVLYVLDRNVVFPSLAIQGQALKDRLGSSLRDSVLVVGIGYPGEALYNFKTRAEDYKIASVCGAASHLHRAVRKR
jgi:hypothetical protein